MGQLGLPSVVLVFMPYLDAKGFVGSSQCGRVID